MGQGARDKFRYLLKGRSSIRFSRPGDASAHFGDGAAVYTHPVILNIRGGGFLWRALIGIVSAFFACLLITRPVAADVPEGFEVYSESGQEVAENTWVEVSGSDIDIYSRFYFDFPTQGESWCFYVDVEYQVTGETVGQWYGAGGVRAYTGRGILSQIITAQGAVGEVSLDLENNDEQDLSVIYFPPWPQTIDASGVGTVQVCVGNTDTARRAYFGLRNISSRGYTSVFSLRLRWHAEFPVEPPVAFCPDGTEVLSSTVSLAAGGTWTAEAMTEYPRLYARYTFTEPGVNGLLHYIDIRANDEQVTRRFYGDEMQSWDPVTGWTNDAYSFSVPNAEESEYDDYNPSAYVTGTNVSLYAAAGYNPLNLVSVCLVPVLTSDYCEDGIEALEAGPVLLGATGGQWSRRLISDDIGGLTHFVVRYRVASPIQNVEVYGKFMPQVQADFFYVEAPIQNAITFTLPTTDVFPLVDDYLQLRFYNRYDQVVLQSVCIIDGAEMHQELSLSAEDCHLNNPDFIQDPATVAFDWETSGTTQWLQLFENGGMALEDGLVYQPPLEGGVWQLEVRASSGGSHEMAFGTQRTGLLDRGPQMKTETLNPALSLYRNNIFVMPQDQIVVESAGAAVDYVCLMERSGMFDVVDCEGCWPEWGPSGSGDSLFTYLLKFLADYVWCFYCKLVQFLAVVANTLWIMLEDILLRIPALPNVLGENFWGELGTFLRLSVEGLLDWMGMFMPNLTEWVSNIIGSVGRWLGWQWRRLGQWLDWLLYDVAVWLAAQLGATPQDIFDAIYDIGHEARLFSLEMQSEIVNETTDALHLFVNAADVLLLIASGVREGMSGNTVAYIGGDMAGVGGFIWDGVEFVNDAVDATPLSALNVVALGVVTIGLMGWSGKKFLHMLEAFS